MLPSALIVRPQPEAAHLSARLQALGWRTLISPLLTIHARPLALPAQRPDALLLTSPRAATHLDPVTCAALHSLPVYAIGPTTAAAAQAAGLGPIRAIGDGNRPTLLQALLADRPARLLFLRGETVRADWAALVQPAGLLLEEVIVYDSTPQPLNAVATHALHQQEVDWVFLTSPRLAHLFCTAFIKTNAPAIPGLAALSQAVAEAAQSLAWPRQIIAPQPNLDSLLAATRFLCHKQINATESP